MSPEDSDDIGDALICVLFTVVHIGGARVA